MFYIQSADRLQRTARWIESLGEKGQNGLEYLKRVIIEDSLGICEDLDRAMDALVGTYFDEWAEVVKNPEKRALFRQVSRLLFHHFILLTIVTWQFVNTDENKPGMETIRERNQDRPVDWPVEAQPLKFDSTSVDGGVWEWRRMAKIKDMRQSNEGTSSIVVNYSDTQIAVFRLPSGKLYSTQQMCPHRRAFVLADGIVGDTPDGKPYVSCPLHKYVFLHSLVGYF
jgi:nitrite reductase (NAD(P)H)